MAQLGLKPALPTEVLSPPLPSRPSCAVRLSEPRRQGSWWAPASAPDFPLSIGGGRGFLLSSCSLLMAGSLLSLGRRWRGSDPEGPHHTRVEACRLLGYEQRPSSEHWSSRQADRSFQGKRSKAWAEELQNQNSERRLLFSHPSHQCRRYCKQQQDLNESAVSLHCLKSSKIPSSPPRKTVQTGT